MNRFEPTPNKPSESIRSEIDETRQRMNTTIDALTERLKGRHLVDELLGFLRSGNGAGTAATVKNKVSETTSATVHAIVDTVKAHPMPVLMMGAGLAWLIYDKQRRTSAPADGYGDLEPYPRATSARSSDPVGEYEDYSEGYTTSGNEFGGSESVGRGSESGGYEDDASTGGLTDRLADGVGHTKERVQGTASQLADKAAELGGHARQGVQQLKRRTVDATAQVRERTRAMATRTREQVTQVAQEHPLETGLTCLAIGMLAGMLVPTPQRVRAEVQPMAQRLKQRAREAGDDLVQRGRRVVAAASEAAREEADAQGLSPEAMTRAHDKQNKTSMDRPRGDWPGQDERSSPPTPAARDAVSDDQRRAAGQVGAPGAPGVPPQPTL